MRRRSLVDRRTVQANLSRYWMINSSYSTVFGLGASSTVLWQMLQLRRSHASGSYAAAMRVLRLVLAKGFQRLDGLPHVGLGPPVRYTRCTASLRTHDVTSSTHERAHESVGALGE
jgi:hypothetical protein